MELITQTLIFLFVTSTMFGVGLMLGFRDIVKGIKGRRWLTKALLGNFVMLPVVAFIVSRLLQLDATLTAALVVLATAPGGPVLVKMVMYFKGDSARSVGLLVILLLLSVVTQPLVLPQFLTEIQVDPKAIVVTLVSTILLPLLGGLALRAQRPVMALKLQSPLQWISTLSMISVWILLPIQHWQHLVTMFIGPAFPAAALFLILALIGGWLLGGPNPSHRRMLSLNCSQPNLAVAVLIATQNFQDPRVVLMLLVFMIMSIFLLLPLCVIFKRQEEAQVVNSRP